MKKYKFIIRKTKETEINICAKNHSEAMIDLIQEMIKQDKDFFVEDNKNIKGLSVKVKEIVDENGKENIQDYENFVKENGFFINEFIDECEDELDEKEEDFLQEYEQIVCEKCGNVISI